MKEMARRRGRVVLSSESSSSDDESNPINSLTRKSDSDNTDVRKSVHSMFDTSSSSSSDEFEKAPACLDDLDIEFKKPVKSELSEVSTSKITPHSEESIDPEEDKPVEYYDFSTILKSQEELKTVAQLMTDYTEKQKKVPSKRNEAPRVKKGPKSRRGTKKSPKNEISKTSKPRPVENMDIDELLRLGESSENTICVRKKRSRDRVDDDLVVVEDDQAVGNDPEESRDVEIRIALPNMHTIKKKDRDMRHRAEMARLYNERRREFQLDLHKVTLLGSLAHGFHLNRYANSDLVQGLALSVIPSKTFYPPAATTTSYIEKITKWFNKTYPVDDSKSDVSVETVMEDFARRKASSLSSLVVMFVAFCRQLGLKCRLLLSLQPRSLKPPISELMRVPKETEKDEDDLFEESPPKKSKPGPSKKLDPPSKKANSSKKQKTSETPLKSKKPASQRTASLRKNGQEKNNKRPNRKVISSDESEEEASTPKSETKKGMDCWAEVYVECDEIWVPADVIRAQVNNATAIGNGVTKPLMYVVAWNRDNTVKDLTRRYSPHWLTATPKLRVDPAWWKEALDPWAPRNTKLERLENKKLDDEEKACPIPATINDCKNHPFYALQRHLLKFEAIWPPDAKPIGFIRGEAVYSRVCVIELHTKETWMRQGKAVRVNEEPYKIVKARPKYDKVSSAVIKDLPLPLFGYWQVDDYIAPPAVDGKVPKNDFGNVEVYKPSMLPAGTVHLQVPGMAKVARKLGIDFAPAVVGWEYHSGGSHPVIEGIVVCKEQQDTLVDAWNAAVDIDAEKQKSKSRTRAIKNWKKLIRSVIIRRRLEKRYNLDLSNVKSK